MDGSWRLGAGIALLAALGSCGGDSGTLLEVNSQSCMSCHNASLEDDYSGPGIENPHPFGTASNLLCTDCHGGNPEGADKIASHVPRPPDIGDNDNLEDDEHAYFNRRTLAGIDKFEDYDVDGVTYSSIDWLQFINPGDLRVVTLGRGCGQCHENHADSVAMSPLGTSMGIFSGALYAIGHENQIPAHQGLYEDTAADLGFRAVADPTFSPGVAEEGEVGSLLEMPVFSVIGQTGGSNIFQNPAYDKDNVNDDQLANNQVVSNSALANLYHEQVAFTCGDCHLGSAGANNRYGDFRASGCTACHMPYGLDGRTKSTDPNLKKNEPQNPDQIEAPERSHIRKHQILSVAKTLPGGPTLPGIDDYACAGCHQGSNRTVMQYWGIRLDQNQNLRNGVQYPIMPVSFQNTTGDQRLFSPQSKNNTFNGRNRFQYIRFEDYDGDSRDDTPEDVHYEAGMGCIDCHGSGDLHGTDLANGGKIMSRQEHNVAISCENCHGSVESYAATTNGTTYAGVAAELAVNDEGVPLRHVVKESDGRYYLYSRLDGETHFIPQTRDVTIDTGATLPDGITPIYSAKASFAMGTADGSPATGIGPMQSGGPSGFTHMENMDCASCHSSWTNTCMGCHLEGQYNTNDNFSNITGEPIAFRERFADFVYQTPIPFQLGIDPDGKITQTSANTKMFFRWRDRHGQRSDVFTFADRNGGGKDASTFAPALSHNALMAHSIRGRVTNANEGPRYCVACHLTTDGMTAFGETAYADFYDAYEARNYAALDFDMLQIEIGRNPGNQRNSPIWVHMVAGLGSGLFLFDAQGRPVNSLDEDDDRKGTENQPPADQFLIDGVTTVALDLDRVVEPDGKSNASSNHALLNGAGGLRDGASDQTMSGPLGASLVERLAHPTNGVRLDAWLDANSDPQGGAAGVLTPP